MENPLNILLIGASGRMGKQIKELALYLPHFHITQKVTREQPELSELSTTDVVLDVSLPHTLEKNLELIIDAKKPLVLATTGHDKAMLHAINHASKHIPILHCCNFAPGIGMIKKMLSMLPDVTTSKIKEVHHKEKKDAPSGTAKELATLIGTPHEVIEVERTGDVIGDHALTLTLDDEIIEISHKALSRSLFAKGALKACQYLSNKEKGLYTTYYD